MGVFVTGAVHHNEWPYMQIGVGQLPASMETAASEQACLNIAGPANKSSTRTESDTYDAFLMESNEKDRAELNENKRDDGRENKEGVD